MTALDGYCVHSRGIMTWRHPSGDILTYPRGSGDCLASRGSTSRSPPADRSSPEGPSPRGEGGGDGLTFHPGPEERRLWRVDPCLVVPSLTYLQGISKSHGIRGIMTPHMLSRSVELCHRRPFAEGRSRNRSCLRQSVVVHGGKSYLDPVQERAAAFGPATVANLGPGFDWLGCAIDGQGDIVTARVLDNVPAGTVVLESISGDGGRLSLEPRNNCAGIAALETVKILGAVPSCGIGLTLEKGLPLGSGMGSSAASAAAAAVAVNSLFGNPLPKTALVGPGLISESTVSGFHADNIAPAVLGGFVLVRSCDPLDLQALTYGSDSLFFVLVNPVFEAPTAEMRAVLPKEVPMAKIVNNCSMGATLVAGILEGDPALVGRALDSDWIIEPVRGPLIPGFLDVKRAAKDAGAYGCTISGAGPTAVAVVENEHVGQRVIEAMKDAFKTSGGLETNSANVVKLDHQGARVV